MQKTEKISYLNQAALKKLLSLLDSASGNGEIAYQNIYKKLTNFFSFNKVSEPENYVDKVFDTVLRKISETEVTFDENYYNYFAVIAHNHLRDFWKLKKRDINFDDLTEDQKPIIDQFSEFERQEKEQKLYCVEECLKSLPENEADLIIRYYQIKKDARIELSEKLGISINTFRVRILRLKEKLERCCNKCMRKFNV